MKHLLALVLVVACAPALSAQLYKYIDKDGKTVYSDQAPPNADSTQMNVQSAAPTPAAGAKSALERDKELQKGRDDARGRAKKADEAAKQARAKEEACATATTNFHVYSDGARVTKFDEKGERVFLDDDQIAAERERSKRQMDEACKKS